MEILIIQDYFKYAMPLDMLARKHGCSKHYILKVIHHYIVGKPYEIMESRRILDEISNDTVTN